jgi:2'-hydroxyisoflavone reductase
MELLILGGTIFLGWQLVEAARRRGHHVTLFNRGQSNPELFPDLEYLRGDRDGGLEALNGRRWDVAIDTNGYVPRLVPESAGLLAAAVEHYTIVSSLSVYADFSSPGINETFPVGQLPPGQHDTETITAGTYGPLKVLCEQVSEACLPGRSLSIRAGLIVGPHDPTGRFTFWPLRVKRGGEVLAPDQPDKPLQLIDVRDLADWIIRMAEARRTGLFNAPGPNTPLTIGEFLDTCHAVTDSDATYTWVSESVLLARSVAPYTELPLWVPSELASFDRFECRRAITAGLAFRPMADTIRATLDWATSHPSQAPSAGLSPEREAALLQAWRELT